MIPNRTVITGACLVLVLADVSSAQDRVADSVLKATKHRMDSLRMGDRLGWNSPNLPRGDFLNGSAPAVITADEVAQVPAPTVDLSAPLTVPSLATVDSVPVVVGNWRGVIETNRLTMQKDVTFFLASADAAVAGAATLALRCRKGKLDAYVDTEQVLGESHKVRVRLGTDPPEHQEWLAGADSTTVLVPGDEKKVQEFVRKLTDYTRLAIQVQPDRASTRAFIFDLAGIAVVDAQLKTACK